MSQQIFLLFALLVLLVLLQYAQAVPVAEAEAAADVTSPTPGNLHLLKVWTVRKR